MLYVHSSESGVECGHPTVSHSTGKSYANNSISALLLTHNNQAAFRHPHVADANAGANSNGHWSCNVLGNDNTNLSANEVQNKGSAFGANHLSAFTRDGFCGLRETENVRSFAVNKLLQITNRDSSESNVGMYCIIIENYYKG